MDPLHLLEKLAPFSFTTISKHTMSVLQAEEGTGRILIARVMHGGAADRSGLIAVGDEVIEVSQYTLFSSVGDPWHFDADPDLQSRNLPMANESESGIQIRNPDPDPTHSGSDSFLQWL